MDHGKIISNIKYKILNIKITYPELSKELAKLGAGLLIETLPKFIKGEITPLPQDESQASYTRKFKSEDAYIKPEDINKAEKQGGEKAAEIWQKIKALNPEPGVWTLQNNKRIKLLEAKIIDNKLKLLKIQKEGKKPVFVS